eukprot:s221_g15.t1
MFRAAPRIQSPDAMSYLFYIACDDLVNGLYKISCMEAAAFLNFQESGVEKPGVAWRKLTEAEKTAWIPDESESQCDAWTYISNMPDWREEFLWTGWPVLCNVEFNYLPKWRPKPSCATIPEESLVRIQELAARYRSHWNLDFHFQPGDFGGDLVRHVMNIYEWGPYRLNVRISLGQIMHGLAHVVTQHWGEHWAQDITLLSWSQAQRHDPVSLMKYMRVALVVLHTETHWALLIFLRGKSLAVTYDGQSHKEILDLSLTLGHYFEEELGGQVKAQFARVPPQEDEWSCGHRCVLHAEHALKFLAKNKWTDLPLEVPRDAVSADKFESLCHLEAFLPPSCPIARTKSLPAEPAKKKLKVEAREADCEAVEACRAVVPHEEVPEKAAGPVGDGEEPAPKKRRTRKSDSSDELKDLEKRLEQKGFSHNVEFQKEHMKLNIQPKRGHWQLFLRNFKDDRSIGCAACRVCRGIARRKLDCEGEAEEIEAENVEAEPEVKEEKPQQLPFLGGRKRGRPRKGQSWEGLASWIEKNRPNIYQCADAENHVWLCRLCNCTLKCQRDGITFISKRELRGMHQDKVKLMELGAENAPKEEPLPLRPCTGADILVEDSFVPQLFAAKQSVQIWLHGGMPFVLAEKGKCPLQNVIFRHMADRLIFKSTECTGKEGPGLCHHCYQLSRNPLLVAELKKWAWKLDLVQMAHLYLLGRPDEVRDHEETIMERDYFDAEVHGKELKFLSSLQRSDAIAQIRQGFVAINRLKRSASLQGIIENRLIDIREVSPQNLEKDIFQNMVRQYQDAVERGECHKDEFEMASKIAAGKLRSEPLVNALFKSALFKISKVEAGAEKRLCTSKFVTPELALEMLVVLGRSKHSEHLLKLLGVNSRVMPRVDLQCELIPRPFVASQSPDVLQENARTALSLLGLNSGSRGFSLICDETAWFATLDLISGLQSCLGYVGGYFTQEPDEKDYSFLTLEEMRECSDDHVARLSQHYLLSRTDSNHHTWCIDILPRPPKKAGLKANSAEKVFAEMGRVLESVVAGNRGVPPVNIAFDSGTGHAKINRALLGLLGPTSLQEAPFFNKCVVKPVHLDCFKFGVLMYEGKFPVLGALDVYHACKRYSYHLATAARILPANL